MISVHISEGDIVIEIESPSYGGSAPSDVEHMLNKLATRALSAYIAAQEDS